MGLFLDVSDLAGNAVVHGQVRKCAYRQTLGAVGSLTIEGLTLVEAMGVLGVLGSDSIDTARLGGVLPGAPAAPAPVQPRPERPAGGTWVASYVDPVAGPPQVPAPPPPAHAPTMPPAAPQGGLPGLAAAPPVVAPPPVPSPPDGAVEAPPAGDIPADVLGASTLRPVIAHLLDRGIAPTPEAMVPEVQRVIARMTKTSPLARLSGDELKTRVKSTLDRLDVMKG